MTIIELLLALSIFSIFITIAIGGFIQALGNQKLTLLLMEGNDTVSLAIEQISREVRTGTDFSVSSDGRTLSFKNARKNSILFTLDDIEGRIRRVENGSEGFITSKNPNVRVSRFNIQKTGVNPERITISLRVAISYKSIGDITTDIQTTIAPRTYYQVFQESTSGGGNQQQNETQL